MGTVDGRSAGGLRAMAGAVLDIVFPRSCVECAGVVEQGAWQYLCSGCVEDITYVGLPHCSTCGWPFAGVVEGLRRCPHCVDLDPHFGQGRTGVLMRGAARSAVHELKYNRGAHMRGDLREIVKHARPLCEFVRGATLVPVPLHARRLRNRGFNQAYWVAEALVAEGGAAGIEELLVRVRDTMTQTLLDRAAREKNMHGAFAMKPGAVVRPDIRYILVDDVFTTGATLNACAEVLRHAGAVQLDVASLGHG